MPTLQPSRVARSTTSFTTGTASAKSATARFKNFVGKGTDTAAAPVLSLQQIAQTSSYCAATYVGSVVTNRGSSPLVGLYRGQMKKSYREQPTRPAS